MSEADAAQEQAIIAESDADRRAGDEAAAIAALRAGVGLHPESLPLRQKLALLLRSTQRYAEALEALRAARKVFPDDPILLYEQGESLRGDRRYREAQGAHEELRRRHPEDPRAQLAAALSLAAAGHPDLALPAVDRLAARFAGNHAFVLGSGEVLLKLGRWRQALSVVDNLLEQAPALVSAWVLRAEAAHRLSRFDWTAAAVRAHDLGGERLECLLWRARVWFADRDRPDHVQHGQALLVRALEVQPRFSEALVETGRAYFRLAQEQNRPELLDTAIKWLTQAVETDPQDGIAKGLRALAQVQRGQDPALGHLAAEAEALPYNGLPGFLGKLHLELHRDPGEALRWLTLAAHVAPEDPGVRGMLADAYLAVGKGGEAEREFRRSLELFEWAGELWLGLGTALAQQGKLAEAVPAFAEAAKRLPGRADVQRGLGGALLALGRGDDAATALRKALELEPTDGRAQLELARAYAAAGRRDEARAQAARARALVDGEDERALAALVRELDG